MLGALAYALCLRNARDAVLGSSSAKANFVQKNMCGNSVWSYAHVCACARLRNHILCVVCKRKSKYMRTNFCTYVDFSVCARLHKNVLCIACIACTVDFTRDATDLKCAFVIGAFGRASSRLSSSGNREMSATIISSDKAPRRFNKNVPGPDILFIFDIQPAACVLNVSTLDVRKYLWLVRSRYCRAERLIKILG